MASPRASDTIESKNTVRATKACKLIFEEYVKEKELKYPSNRDELAFALRDFYAYVRKKDGSRYSRGSFISLRFGLRRYFMSLFHVDISKDKEFNEANEVYEAQCEYLKKIGLGESERRPAITNEDIRKLYECGLFSTDFPTTLQNKVFFEIVFYFSRRKRQSLRQLRKDHFKIKVNTQGQRCVARSDNEHESAGMMVANGTPWCPVYSFEKYLSHLNPLNEFLFQRPRETPDQMVWYENQVLGKNTLGRKMKALSLQANLSFEYTNHSIRVTTIAIRSSSLSNIMSIMAKTSANMDTSHNKQHSATKLADCSAVLGKEQELQETPVFNSTTDNCSSQTRKRRLKEEFPSAQNEATHEVGMKRKVSIPAVVKDDENIEPEVQSLISSQLELTKSRRKAPRSQVRKVVRPDEEHNVGAEVSSTPVESSIEPSVEPLKESSMPLAVQASVQSVVEVPVESSAKSSVQVMKSEPGSYDEKPGESHTLPSFVKDDATAKIIVSSSNRSVQTTPHEHEYCTTSNTANEASVIEEDYQRKYFQLLNTMNEMQNKFLLSQRNFEELVQAREAYIEELKNTLEAKHKEVISTRQTIDTNYKKISELQERKKLYEDELENLNKKVKNMKEKELNLTLQISKDDHEQLKCVIEKQQEVLEFYKLLTSVNVEKVNVENNASVVYDKFRCSLTTARSREFNFMLSYDPEFAEIEYSLLEADSRSNDPSFPAYLKEQIFFECEQAPNFLCRLIQSMQPSGSQS